MAAQKHVYTYGYTKVSAKDVGHSASTDSKKVCARRVNESSASECYDRPKADVLSTVCMYSTHNVNLCSQIASYR